MDAVFLNLVNISITASYIAIAVILFRFLLKKAPKAYTCILWLLVAFRLFIPVTDSGLLSFASNFSLIPSTEVLPNSFIDNDSPQFNVNFGIDTIDIRVNDYLNDRYAEGVTVPANMGNNLMTVLGMIWIIVCAAIILYAIGSYIYFRRKTKASICVKENTFICDYISTPFILGVIRPKILLPSTLGEEESSYVLAHEKAHLKRLDHIWKPLGFMLLAVHWFNPILWLSYILFCRDIELACDEYVIKTMNSDDKKAYSTALLNCSVPKKLISAYPLAFGEIGVKERIKTILKYKKPAVITSIIAVILCIITAVCFLSNPQKVSLKEAISEYAISAIDEIEFDDGKVICFTDNKNDFEYVLNEMNEITMGKSPVSYRNFNNSDKSITFYYNNPDYDYS
ncbi:MAG: M56 family metallopeptidase, partial [Eubacterium sp.]|nr:M56 family metallopeptidase [Eubacterium sp.]